MVELDGGRIRTRKEGQGVGTHQPAWGESKTVLFQRMTSQTQEKNRNFAPDGRPRAKRKVGRVKRLFRLHPKETAWGALTTDETRWSIKTVSRRNRRLDLRRERQAARSGLANEVR